MTHHQYQRYLHIDLPKKQSTFLWGARKTGKSTYLRDHYESSVYYDLLKSDLYLRFSKEPYLFREEILALTPLQLNSPIIVDEIQKIPMLLNEVHWLIENSDASFILCGSSARKLRQTGVNLLGGRAWSYYFYPLVYKEITDFDLLKVLNIGTIPSHYTSSHPVKALRAYIGDYLTEEIKAEGLVRNLPTFALFLDNVGYSHGEMINYTNIARECGIDAKTVKEYYQILIDTLLGNYLFPYHKRVKRKIISSTPKFYLFDVGVANILSKRTILDLKGSEAGKALEHYILTELIAYRGLNDKTYDITYWRTKSGLEVDFILGSAEVAIEVKVSSTIRSTELTGLQAFAEEHHTKNLYCISLEPRTRRVKKDGFDILIYPVEKFLELLWNHQII